MKKLTHEEFIEKFKLNPHYNDIILMGEYVNKRTKIHCKCKICEYEWDTVPEVLYRQLPWCNKCATKESILKNTKKSFDEKKEQLEKESEIAECVDFLEEVKVHESYKIKIKCKTCGCEHIRGFFDLLKMKNCPSCLKNKRLTSEENFLKYFNETQQSKNISLLSKFVNSEEPINCKCKICGFDRINCKYQNKISDNILISRLSEIFDLSKIDFNECNNYCFTNLMKKKFVKIIKTIQL